jgi:Family of unknown function (DUF6221)
MDEAIGWLREQVQARMATARVAAAVEGGDHASWLPAYGTVVDAADEDWAITTGTLDEIAAHMALNDPQDAIARCEAELGILNLYRLWAAEDLSGNAALGAAACAVSDAVRHLASGYKHRDGYAEHWGTA